MPGGRIIILGGGSLALHAMHSIAWEWPLKRPSLIFLPSESVIFNIGHYVGIIRIMHALTLGISGKGLYSLMGLFSFTTLIGKILFLPLAFQARPLSASRWHSVAFSSRGKGSRTQPTAQRTKSELTHRPTGQDRSTGVETGAPGLEPGHRSGSTEPGAGM